MELIIKYGQVYIRLPDDDPDAFDLVGDVLQFFINRIVEADL